jgi:hypothetical protein
MKRGKEKKTKWRIDRLGVRKKWGIVKTNWLLGV